MNFAFYVSNKATRLSRLLDDNNIALLSDIKVIFSDDIENLYIEEKLKKLNIAYELLNYKEIEAEKGQKNLVLSNKLLEVLNEYEIDYCFCFGGHILKGELLDEFENRIINFHPAILPDYPGTRAIDQAIAHKANLLGNTAHFIDAGMDTGPIIMQSVIPAVAFYDGGYDIVLDIQIEMLYKIYELLKVEKIRVIDNAVKIEGADYSIYSIFPHF